ncbi:hypothetical protein ACLOJK_022035 [Asimina triloba]
MASQSLHHIEEDEPATVIEEEEIEKENPEYNIWWHNDCLLTSWLLGSMAEDVLTDPHPPPPTSAPPRVILQSPSCRRRHQSPFFRRVRCGA